MPILVSPTLLTLSAQQADAALLMINEDNRPWPAEVHLYRWQQHDDVEHLSPATGHDRRPGPVRSGAKSEATAAASAVAAIRK